MSGAGSCLRSRLFFADLRDGSLRVASLIFYILLGPALYALLRLRAGR